MSLSTFRRNLIDLLISEEGQQCRYCRKPVKRNFFHGQYNNDDVTVDHIIPRRKGGTNDRANLALACRACNHAKGDRDLADFLADPRPAPERREKPRRRKLSRGVKFVPVPKEEKPRRGTLAYAIKAGEVNAHGGAYRRPKPNESGVRIAKPKMTAIETAKWLREQAEKKGKPWPLA